MPEGTPLTQVNGLWTNGHLRFDPIVPSIWPPRPGWDIRLASSRADAEPVGRIRWHGLWREFVLRTAEGYVFAHDCLSDIAQFCRDRNAEARNAKCDFAGDAEKTLRARVNWWYGWDRNVDPQ